MELINLFKTPGKFSYLPKNARYGILFLFLSWAGHFLLYYLINMISPNLIPREMLLQHLAIAVMICYFVLRLKNWARILCVFGNIVIIMFYIGYLFTTFASIGRFGLLILSVCVCCLFGLTSFFLSRSDTVAFFKVQSPKPNRDQTMQEIGKTDGKDHPES